jgi:hypothetical protein
MIINPEDIKINYLNIKRTERNQLLQISDKYMIIDFPITDYQRYLIKTYRKALRDYFELPEVINWTFTLENQEFPPLPTFPDLSEDNQRANQLPYIEVPPMEIDNNTSNIISL